MGNDAEEMKLEPPHPGELIKEDILPQLEMTIKDLASHLGVSRVALSELVNEKRSVSMEMAQRLGKAFGNGTRFWLALQMQYDLWHAEQTSKVSVKPLKWKTSNAA
jgi:addiction module HigA family antidote